MGGTDDNGPVAVATAGTIMDYVDDDVQSTGAKTTTTKKGNSGGADVLPRKLVAQEYINGTPSDLEGLKQLCFHMGCAVMAGMVVGRALERLRGGEGCCATACLMLVAGELMLGLVSSFYFAGFHESIHGTAFSSRAVYRVVSHLFGFTIFRGANWYYYFHWHHHRFTNDPERDPELSGTTTDRADPTASQSTAQALGQYALFLSGWPFGFERIPGMVRHALGKPDPESWVDTDQKRKVVQAEYACYTTGYALLAAAALLYPLSVGSRLWYYWLLPHILGAGHLRWYQTAEHRGCKPGHFTDTNAWLVSRTTVTWWFYTRLAWNMPYHQEHHAWPNVPFYLLPKLHAAVTAGGNRPKSGCTPNGAHGFAWIHRVLFNQALNGGEPVDPTLKQD